ncbi:mucin-5AC-like [Anopheles nili]|uniref:mucin-5AC-like n=1 Tax=Anopheles nili TaxID=185578 RepID=UPI00237C2826|nr:mucin-5AC-like [Anopheles nili]
MLLQVLVPCLALLELCAAGYVTVPLQSPAGVTYVNAQHHVGLLAGPARYTVGHVPTVVENRQAAVAVSPAPAPTYYSYNLQPQHVQPVFGKASYTPAVQYHHTTTYGNPTVRVYEPKSFVYGVQGGGTTTHTVQSVPVPVPVPVPVTPAPVPHHPVAVPVHVPVHVPVPVPVTPTYTKTVTTGPSYVPAIIPQEKQVPIVRSRKFKVRRPAIQNQFYDIEERVIIRPVGSALVELEQPVSQTETQTKTTKTTTTTFVEKRPVYGPPSTPAPAPAPVPLPAVPEDESYGTRTVTSRPHVVTQTTTVYTERPPLKGGYDRIEVASKSAASTSRVSDAEFIDTAPAVPSQPAERPFFTQGHAILHGHHQTAYVPHPFAPHLAPHPFVYHPANAGHLLHHVAYVDPHPAHPASTLLHVPSTTPLYPVGPTTVDCDRDGSKTPASYLPPSTVTTTPEVLVTPAPTTPTPPASATPGTSFADAVDEEYDDSIVVDARSGGRNSNFSDYDSVTDADYGESATVTAATTTTNTAPLAYHRQGDRFSQERAAAIEVSYATRTTPASDIVAFDPSTAVFDLGPEVHVTTPSPRPVVSSTPSTTPRSSVTIISSTTPRTVSARFSSSSSSNSAEIQSHGVASQSVVVGQGLTQEQIHANQEQFIRLLSERDSIAEVGFGPKTDSSGSLIDTYVRSRVLSATPAPRDAKETSRTVNIRRIVVSRPVETEQEVEVREHSYGSTLAPPPLAHPSYEHKRDVSEVSERSAGSQEPPVYVTAKPPAFANDQEQ